MVFKSVQGTKIKIPSEIKPRLAQCPGNFKYIFKMHQSKYFFVPYSDDPNDEEALQHICTGSGGQFLESSKTDVQDIVALLSQSIQTSQVNFLNITFVSLIAHPLSF